MKMPSVMQHQHKFSEVPQARIERSQFDRSHAYKTTFDAGLLIPFYVDEALPGDTFHLRTNGFVRMTTPLKPLMDNLYVDTFFFAVPYRLVWANWVKFNGEQTNPGDSTSYTVPQQQTLGTAYTIGSLADYMGLPTQVATVTHSALFHRAYYLIYNQWFRDENLINSVVISTGDGPDAWGPTNAPQRRGKRHDYFTSCLPWPQKGTAVTIPLGTSAPVIRASASSYPGLVGSVSGVTGYPATTAAADPSAMQVINGAAPFAAAERLNWGSGTAPGLVADLTGASAATINSLRQAFQIQKMLERDARGGTRYTEIVKAHFGVTSPDARLQRPEYLGGGTSPIIMSPIAQTNATGVTGTPQGNLAAIGTGSFMGHGFVKSFTEHCLLIGIVSVRSDLTYQQGMERMWRRSTRYDFYWPALAHLGEQSVLNSEIYYQGNAQDNNTFGYQERYAEYRYKPSKVTGAFRSSSGASLDVWHLAQNFSVLPTLNQTFIEENPPMARVVAVPAEPDFFGDFWFDLKCARPMPVFSVPGLIDHF